MALKIAAQPLKRIVSNVEVERKFNPRSKFASLLANHTWWTLQTQNHKSFNHQERTPFTVLSQPAQLIRDTYYDTEDNYLSKLGLWVRQRYVAVLPLSSAWLKSNEDREAARGKCKGQWNAKLRLGGHFSNSQFVEFDGKMNVSHEVLRITGTRTRLEDLQVVADLQTRRSVWEVTQLADGMAPSAKMTIVVDVVTEAAVDENEMDESTFTHTIGEVELFQVVVTDGKDNVEHEAHRKEIVAQRVKELEEFMLVHTDLFSTSPTPIGKLTAYYTWKAGRSQP